MADDIAGRKAFVVCARWSRHCTTDHDVESRLVVSSVWLAAGNRPLGLESYAFSLIQKNVKLPG